MNTIKRDVYVLRNAIKIPIEVTQGTDMVAIELTVRDFDIPVTAAAVAYAYRGSMKKPHSSLCDVSGNVITFTPIKNFFEVGINELQIRVIDGEKALLSFREKVKCTGAMPFPDDDAEEQQTLVEQILAKTGKEEGERKEADEKVKEEIDVERKRINNLTKLEEGSTTGDAELADMRVGADGETYDTAGEAVRQQVNNLKDAIELLNKGGLDIKDEFLSEQIDSWLDKHPEATTTVQDGVITEEKMNAEFLSWIKKDYVTPEMFGAKGDGVTDDSDAIKKAIESTRPIFLNNGAVYSVKSQLIFLNAVIYGNNATIQLDHEDVNHEFSVYITGTSKVYNTSFLLNYNGGYIGGINISDSKNMTFYNCRFVVADGRGTNGYVDLYSNNENVLFENCYFRINTPNHIGGIWVREFDSQKTSKNITFRDCTIHSASKDESIACWHWKGKVENVVLDGCVIESIEGTTAPHFLTFKVLNGIIRNTILKPLNNTGSALNISEVDDSANYDDNVKIYNSTIINGCSCEDGIIRTGKKLTIYNCDIVSISESGTVGISGTDSGETYCYNCNVTSEHDISFACKLHMQGCTVTVVNALGIGQIFRADATIQDCAFRGMDATMFVQNFGSELEFKAYNSIFDIACLRFLINCTKIELFNNKVKASNIYCPNASGYVTGNIIEVGDVGECGKAICKNNLVNGIIA